MIFKILAIGVVLFFVYIVFFKKNREASIKNKKKYDQITDTMVECPTCSVYVSKEESILSNGKYYCSEKCLKH